MIWNSFKIAWRNLKKGKTYTFLNLFELSVAFGAAILLYIYALFQLSYDQFHENGDRIYQVYATEHTQKGPEVNSTKPLPFASLAGRSSQGRKDNSLQWRPFNSEPGRRPA